MMLSPDGRSIYTSLNDPYLVEGYDVRKNGKLEYRGCIFENTETDCQIVVDPPTTIKLNAINPNGKDFYFSWPGVTGGGTWAIFRQKR